MAQKVFEYVVSENDITQSFFLARTLLFTPKLVRIWREYHWNGQKGAISKMALPLAHWTKSSQNRLKIYKDLPNIPNLLAM